ncbi:MAG: glycosyltransferase family 9 protein [Planctomycetaceae bacterium]
MTDLTHIQARRICIIKPSAFGDVVQTLPILPVLRERFPRARISWVVRSELRGLLDGHPCLDEVVPWCRRGGIGIWWRFLRDLRRREFDVAFDLQGLLRTAAMSLATRAPLRVGLETAREGAHWACHVTLRDTGPQVPAHLRYWRVAEALGLGERRRETIVDTSPEDRSWANGQVAQLAAPVLAVCPGARWATKRWPPEKFAAIAARAMRRYGFATVILGGKDEAETAGRLEYELRRFGLSARVRNLASRTSIKQLAALLQRSDVLLTNDSGPMHLAAGLGTRVAGVFTCTSPARSGPPGDRHQLITTALPCAGCYKKRCPRRGARHLACLSDVSIDGVWRGFQRLVERARKRAA